MNSPKNGILRMIAAGGFVFLLPGIPGVTGLAAAAEEHQAAAASGHVPAVTVAAAGQREFRQRVAISGTLLPKETSLVFPAIGGYAITELAAESGDIVRAGDVLARLDDRVLRAQVLQAEAAIAQAKAASAQAQSQVVASEASLDQANLTLTRTRSLRERGASAEAVLQETQTAARTAEANLRAARDAVAAAEAQIAQAEASRDLVRTNLESAQVLAPVGGMITVRNGLVGAIASTSGDPIYQIAQDGVVELEVRVLETELNRLSVGNPVEIRIAGRQLVAGKVRLIAPIVDRESRLGTVRITLDSTEGLRAGLFAAGWITTAQRNGLGVPATAVIMDATGSYVLHPDDKGVLQRRNVTPRLLWNDWIEVTGDLRPGEGVVTSAGAFFAPGDRIAPVYEADGHAADSGSE